MISNVIRFQYYHAPCGDLLLGALEGKLCLCDWVCRIHKQPVANRLQRTLHSVVYKEGEVDIIREAARQLDEYFNRKRTSFNIPLLPLGTGFQLDVWSGLLQIPYGETRSYSEFSNEINRAGAVRAVANANAANALSIFIPCHRIVGKNRRLVGYAGGLEAKRYLLNLERPDSCPSF